MGDQRRPRHAAIVKGAAVAVVLASTGCAIGGERQPPPQVDATASAQHVGLLLLDVPLRAVDGVLRLLDGLLCGADPLVTQAMQAPGRAGAAVGSALSEGLGATAAQLR